RRVSHRASPGPWLYPLSLHDALPILMPLCRGALASVPHQDRQLGPQRRQEGFYGLCTIRGCGLVANGHAAACCDRAGGLTYVARSEEHTSELQSRENLACRLLLDKKN